MAETNRIISCYGVREQHLLHAAFTLQRSPPPPFARVATSPHRCSNEGFLTNRSLSAPLQICNWPMTLRGSIGSPLSALAQHFVVCLGQHCCINDTFPPSKCGSSCCADIICDEVTDNYMVSKQSVVSEGITMALVYSLLVSKANPWTLLYCWTLQRHGIYLTFLDDFPLIRKALEGCYVQ